MGAARQVAWSGVPSQNGGSEPQGAAGRGPLSSASGKTPEDNAGSFEPLIAEAARQRADLVVLGETLTYFGPG